MDKKIKLLLLCLGIVSLSAAALSGWIYFSAQAKIAEYANRQTALEKQNKYLQEKLDASQREVRHWGEKSEAVTLALNKLGKEHTLLQSQYDSLLKEKESLAEENKNLSAELERLDKLYAQTQEKAKLGASDKFLAALLEEKASLEVKIEKLKADISSREAQIEDMEKQVRPTKEKVAQLEKEKEALEKKLDNFRKVSGVLSNDLLKERKKTSALAQELDQTEARLRSITDEKDRLAAQLAKMKQALEQRLVELDRTKKVLEGAVAGAEKVARKDEPASIQLSPIVVKAEPARKIFSEQAEQEIGALPAELSKQRLIEERTVELVGRIITVNTQHRFVVIDIGRDEGVEKGMSFDVYRKNKKVGKVVVIETRKNIAACDIKEMDVRRLKVNDTVRR